jgi:hypothetical protein
MRNQTVLSGFYLLYLIAVVVNFLGCLWCVCSAAFACRFGCFGASASARAAALHR